MDVLSAEMVSQFRQQGYLLVRNCIPPSAIDVLRSAAANTINRRGATGGYLPLLPMTSQSNQHQPPAAPSQDEGGSSQQRLAATTVMARKGGEEVKTRQSRRKRRSLGSKLLEEERLLRKQYSLTRKELLHSQHVDASRILALRAAQRHMPSQEQLIDTFQRRPRAAQFVQAMSAHEKSWLYTWREEAVLRQSVAGDFGRHIGEMTAHMLGTLAVRMYCDSLTCRPPMSGWCPLGVDLRAEHRSVNAVIPISEASAGEPFWHVLPGSHHTVGAAVSSGKVVTLDTSPFSSLPVLKGFPDLLRHHPSGVGVPFPAVGDMLFFNSYLAKSVYPRMGLTQSEASPMSGRGSRLLEQSPAYYTVSIIPDGIVHDGASRGWMTDHQNGPLFGLKKGQPINDPEAFPLLYRWEGLE